MKNPHYCFLAFCFSLFACIQTPEETKRSLLQAEMCMDAYPDSALNILRCIAQPEKLEGSAQAEYALLLSQAIDKNFIDETSDSLILFAVKYYDDERANQVKRGQALYYYGRVQQESGENEEALQTFLKAEPILASVREYRMLGLMMEDIAHINLQQSHNDGAVWYMKKAIEYYRLCDENLGVALAYQHLGRVLVQKNETDSVQWYAEASLKLLPNNPPKVKEGYYDLLSLLQKKNKNYPEAINYVMKAMSEAPNNYNIYYKYYKLGNLYRIMGKYSEALSYFEQCLMSANRVILCDTYLSMSRIAKSQEDYKQAFFFKEKSDSIRGLVSSENIQTSIAQIQRKYQYEKYQKENVEIRLEKTIHLFIFVTLILIVLFITYLIYKKLRMEKTEGEKKTQLIKHNEQKIDQLQQRLEKLIRQNLDESDSKIKELRQQILLLTDENQKLYGSISIQMSSLIDDLKKGKLIAENLTKQEFEELLNLTNSLYGNCVKNLQTRFKLSDKNIEYICLLLLGFTSAEMVVIFSYASYDNNRKSKSRLKKHFNLAENEELEAFIKSCGDK